MKKLSIIVLLCALLSSCASVDLEKVACMENGGRWVNTGLISKGCVVSYSDAGESCRNSEECQGVCYWNENSEFGACAADSYPTHATCKPLFVNGKKKEVICE